MREYRLGEIFNLQMGKTPSRNNLSYWGSKDNQWISIADLSKSGKYIEETKEYLSDRAVEESGISVIPANTVVMSFKLSIGKTAITPKSMYSNEAIMAFCDKKVTGLLPDYIYYMFLRRKWESGTNKAVMGNTLNKSTLSNIKVKIHKIDKQREIVKILDCASQIIDDREKQLHELDALVKARFVEMFGSPVSNPKKWQVEAMNDVAPIVNYAGSLGDDVWLLNLDMVEAQTGEIIEYLIVSKEMVGNSTCTFDTTNVLYSKLRPYLNKVVIPDRCGYATSELLPLKPLPTKLNREYLTFLLRTDDFVKLISAKVTGAKMPRVSMKDFKNFDVPIPPLSLQNEFAAFVSQVDKSKVAVQKALDEAQTLFDSLMQEYFG